MSITAESLSIVEPFRTLVIKNYEGPVTDPETLWVNSANGNLHRGTVNLELPEFTNGTLNLTPQGATNSGTFVLQYTSNGKVCHAQLIQSATVSQLNLGAKLTFSETLPVGIRPRFTTRNCVWVLNGVTQTLGYIKFDTNGTIEIGVGLDGLFSGLLGNLFIYSTTTGYLV